MRRMSASVSAAVIVTHWSLRLNEKSGSSGMRIARSSYRLYTVLSSSIRATPSVVEVSRPDFSSMYVVVGYFSDHHAV